MSDGHIKDAVTAELDKAQLPAAEALQLTGLLDCLSGVASDTMQSLEDHGEDR